MRHIINHRLHILLFRPHDGGSKNDGQILHLHFIHFAVVHNFLQVQNDMFQRVVIVRRQSIYQLFYLLQAQPRIFDLVRFYEFRIQRVRHQRFRHLPEVGLQQAADDVHVVPTRVFLRYIVVILVDFLRQSRHGRIVTGHTVDTDGIQPPLVHYPRADFHETRDELVVGGWYALFERHPEGGTFRCRRGVR